MCSIFGIIGDQKDPLKSFELLSHRGRDNTNFIQTKDYFFGSHRLAIESFGLSHNQPLQKKGYIALFNGEIYNYKELIDKFNLDAKDEIETILELFLKFKDNFVSYLRGMFAIAIFNINTKELWLFRDLVGKKPLYYSYYNGVFIFSSEPKAIYNEIGFRLNRRAIHQFLGFGTMPYNLTLSKDVYKLPPATYLYFKDSIKFYSYDDILETEIKYFNKEDAISALKKALIEAIEIRVPNVKYGVLVSGGLDSSLVAALLNSLVDKKIDIFSIGYDGYKKYDERLFSKEVASHLKANFYSYNFTKDDFFDTLDELLDYIDEPIGDPAQIPLYFLIKKAKEQGFRVLFSGDGSDELFLGYRTYKEYLMMEQVKDLPYANWLKNHLKSNFSLNKEWEWYKRALNKEVIFRSTAEIYTDRQLNRLLRLQERDNKNFEYLQDYWSRFENSDRNIIDWFSYLDIKVQLAEFYLSKVDRVSMLAGVEVRSPFVDKEIVKLAFSIDPNIRFDTQNVKSLLKEIAKEYLPNSIISRKKKGLNYPFLEWILQENGIDAIYKANERLPIFKEEQLDFLSQKAKSGKFKQHLFPLFILSRWILRHF